MWVIILFFWMIDVICNLEVYENIRVIINNIECNGNIIFECEYGFYLV